MFSWTIFVAVSITAVIFSCILYAKNKKRRKSALKLERITTRENHDVKIIVAGFARSGTASLSRAFTYLNYGKVAHIETNTFKENFEYGRWWVGKEEMLQNGKPINFSEFFNLYKIDIAMDWPLSLFWKEILETYSDAKVIVCVRDFDKWHVSINNLLFNVLRSKQMYFASFLGPVFNEIYNVWWNKFVNMYGGEDVFKDKTALKLKHYQCIEDIQNTMKNKGKLNNLLIYNCIKDGWKPLCDFLDISHVPDIPFPRSNSGTSLSDRVMKNIKLKLLTFAGINSQ